VHHAHPLVRRVSRPRGHGAADAHGAGGFAVELSEAIWHHRLHEGRLSRALGGEDGARVLDRIRKLAATAIAPDDARGVASSGNLPAATDAAPEEDAPANTGAADRPVSRSADRAITPPCIPPIIRLPSPAQSKKRARGQIGAAGGATTLLERPGTWPAGQPCLLTSSHAMTINAAAAAKVMASREGQGGACSSASGGALADASTARTDKDSGAKPGCGGRRSCSSNGSVSQRAPSHSTSAPGREAAAQMDRLASLVEAPGDLMESETCANALSAAATLLGLTHALHQPAASSATSALELHRSSVTSTGLAWPSPTFDEQQVLRRIAEPELAAGWEAMLPEPEMMALGTAKM